MNNFFRRTLTGVWIVLFILGGFWLHPVSFFITGLVLMTGTQYEYLVMIKNMGIRAQVFPGIAVSIVIYVIATMAAAGIISLKWLLLGIPLFTAVIIIELYRKQDRPFDSLAHTVFSVLYTAVPFSLFPFAAFSHEGISSLLPHANILFSPGIILGFFFLLWANDTGAYLTGVLAGKHRLMERISPKKTWEGFFGGLMTAALVAWLLSGWIGVVDAKEWMFVALIVSVTGTYGDLAESMLKRSNGVKDSGTILPGHGGFLDRFDSAIISFPLVYLFISLLG
ncbi:MAG TPA: phosphatidate cytidylyltransferase [Bacteroidales bacterium]|nr:phosphatidate cytidylyltransferase [Bacteroidales bacterium]